jgi:hypothetical protein
MRKWAFSGEVVLQDTASPSRAKRTPGQLMFRKSLIVGCLLASGSALAQTPYTAPEMQALLAKGLLVSSSDLEGGKVFTGRVTLAADGKLSGTITPAGDKAIALTGNWKLKGAQLCRTIEPIEPDEVCETWVKSGAKQATIQVNGKAASINKW